MNAFFRIGEITSFHGLAGYCKVLPIDYDKNRFSDLINKYVYLVDKIITSDDEIKKSLYIQIEDIKFLNKFILIKFFKFDKLEQVVSFKNKHIFINRSDAIVLFENEYYIQDLIGAKVYDNDTLIGIVDDVIFNKKQQILSVMNNDKNIYIPMFDEFIKKISINEKTIMVSLIEGML